MSERVKEALARLIADVKTCQAAGRKVPTALLREAEAALSATPPTDCDCATLRSEVARLTEALEVGGCDCQRYPTHISNSCPLHNENPREPDPDEHPCPTCATLREQVERYRAALVEITEIHGQTGEDAVEMFDIAERALSPTPPADASVCSGCGGRLWQTLGVRVGEPGVMGPLHCPTCQPQRKEGESDG